MTFLARIFDTVDSLKASDINSRKVPFTNQWGGLGSFGGMNWGTQPGASYDYRAAAGELLDNSVVAACVNQIAQALSSAPPILEERQGDTWERVEDHPCIALLQQPNKYYGDSHLWAATAGSECVHGQAYWTIERRKDGLPGELWWQDPRSMRVIASESEWIESYELQNGGRTTKLDNSDVIHFRHALNPRNPREGWSPLSTGLRQVAGDNGAASYHGAILRNSGVLSMLISVKDTAAGAMVSPDQIQTFVAQLKQKLFGEGAGGMAGLNIPLDVQKMGFSPDEMALDKLIAYYETRICALLGVDPMVINLSAGAEHRTYANMAEAINDFWERRILPMRARHADELGAQYLPLWGLDTDKYRISWDYSNIAALQENEDEKHVRVREDYKAGVIDRYTAQTWLGIDAEESDKGVYSAAKPATDPQSPDAANPQGSETKSMEKQPLTPAAMAWTDEELDAQTTLGIDDVKEALIKSTPEKRALNEAKQVEGKKA